jgi:DNA-directed RNA polymerase specialized sigma24 family protein
VSPEGYESFVKEARPRLMSALIAHHGSDLGAEATDEALMYGWANWERVGVTANPIGYLYKVGDRFAQRREFRSRREPSTDPGILGLAAEGSAWIVEDPDTELVGLLQQLPTNQRGAVLLVHAFGCTYQMAADTLDVPLSTLTNDVHRGIKALRALPQLQKQGVTT